MVDNEFVSVNDGRNDVGLVNGGRNEFCLVNGGRNEFYGTVMLPNSFSSVSSGMNSVVVWAEFFVPIVADQKQFMNNDVFDFMNGEAYEFN